MGVDAYLTALAKEGPLPEIDIYDARGVAFAPDAILLHIGAPLLRWLAGGGLAPCACPLEHAFAAHSRLVGDMRKAGHDPPATNTIPTGLRASMFVRRLSPAPR